MIFEKHMNNALYDIRNEIHALGQQYPHLSEFFGLSHSGLIDTETEKLVESFCYKLTDSEAQRKSLITNTIKPFVDFQFSEWFRPFPASVICEYNNFSEFETTDKTLKENKILKFSITLDGKKYNFSSDSKLKLSPIVVQDSYFTQSETASFLNIKFENMLFENIRYLKPKIRIYLNIPEAQKNLHLIYYLFNSTVYNHKLKLKFDDKITEINTKIFSIPFNDMLNEKEFVYFGKQNKFNFINHIFNYLHHYFYLDIDLTEISEPISTRNFILEIPLSREVFSEFNGNKNFIKTNCIPLYDIYKDKVETLNFDFDINLKEKEIYNLKENKVIEITDCRFFDFKDKKLKKLPDAVTINANISYVPGIAFDIIQILSNSEPEKELKGHIEANAIFTNLLSNKEDLISNEVILEDNFSTLFGTIISRQTPTIFYSDLISNQDIFNFLYNWNYYIGKQMNNYSMLKDYFEKIGTHYFNFKEIFHDYFSNMYLAFWDIYAMMKDNGKPKIGSRYRIKSRSLKDEYFIDRLMEQVMNNISETDLTYEIIRS